LVARLNICWKQGAWSKRSTWWVGPTTAPTPYLADTGVLTELLCDAHGDTMQLHGQQIAERRAVFQGEQALLETLHNLARPRTYGAHHRTTLPPALLTYLVRVVFLLFGPFPPAKRSFVS
jgi:hypothetical protein